MSKLKCYEYLFCLGTLAGGGAAIISPTVAGSLFYNINDIDYCSYKSTEYIQIMLFEINPKATDTFNEFIWFMFCSGQ